MLWSSSGPNVNWISIQPALIPEGITVGAYYYHPWHADDFHHNEGYLHDLLEPWHQPVLGEYDDTRPEVIAQHLAWNRQANIQLWVCSWCGLWFREDTTISNTILKHPNLGDHKITLLYESVAVALSEIMYQIWYTYGSKRKLWTCTKFGTLVLPWYPCLPVTTRPIVQSVPE